MFKNLALLCASFILTASALALPTTTTNVVTMPVIEERGALHACSLQVKRWYNTGFDTAYFSAALNPDNSVNNAFNFWTQESDPTPEGDELVPWVVGSSTLRIWNVRDPVDRNDGGEMSFQYGSQNWNSESSQCVVVPIGNQPLAGYTEVACNFLCDH